MIAEAEYRGKGYAREAVAMLMRYGVESLGVTRYFCKVIQSCSVSHQQIVTRDHSHLASND
jgi:Acetyltransferase (GNAT) domain